MAELSDRAENSSDDEEFWIDWMDFKYRSPKSFEIRKHPFDDLSDRKFEERFRLNKTTILRILDEIEDKLEYSSDRNQSVTPMNQILNTLRFLATGTFHLVVGDAFGVDKSTSCRIIQKVIPLICRLAIKFIKFPDTQEGRKKVMCQFFDNSGFPGIIGAVDGTHIPIFSPGGESAEAFRNRKGYFSINVQLVCDPDLYALDMVARWPGSLHDSTIFDFSLIRAKFENNEVPEGYLIGDSGYSCRSYLLTPVPKPVNSQKESNYNAAHVQARNCIERTNGVIKRRFPALKYGLRIKTERIPELIVAAVVLHNIARMVGDTDPPEDMELSSYIDKRRKAGIIVDFEEIDAEPPPHNFAGNTSQRSAVIESHF